jgi:tripartite ATP-independent transporter DctP family solute receptor
VKKIKKVLVILMVVSLTASLLAGCGSKPATPPVDDGKTYSMRLATVVSAPHPWIDMADYFAAEVSKKTDGKITVTVYPSGTLGDDQTTIDEMRIGTLDFVVGGAQNAASFIPEYQVFGLSYLFENTDHFEKAIANNSPVFKRYAQLHDEKKLDLVLLSLTGGGVRNASSNLRPIVTPADLSGVKMRLPGSPIEGKIWSAFGALPTSLPWNEIYSAIQTGVVNAFESTISGYYGSKLYEVSPYLSKTEHLYMLSHFTMSQKTYNDLPENYRAIIREVAEEAGILGTQKGWEAGDVLLDEMISKYGLKVNEVNKASFIEKVLPLHDELAKDMNAADILKMIREVR